MKEREREIVLMKNFVALRLQSFPSDVMTEDCFLIVYKHPLLGDASEEMNYAFDQFLISYCFCFFCFMFPL